MTAYKRFSPGLFSGFWLIAMIALWVSFAPVPAGGQASYIIVVGNSMEPNFHIGDLVIVHSESEYEVGDAVVYRNQQLENFVFHRIIAGQLGKFTLQGDNNTWVDTYQPDRTEILGKLWLHIPQGGVVFQKIREPLVMALAAGLLGGSLALSFLAGRSKGKNQMNKDTLTTLQHKIRDWAARLSASAPTPRSDSDPTPWWEGLFFGLGLLACGSLVLAILSFSRPATRIVNNDLRYDQLGIFAYSASAPESVYDASAIQSGDPIFPGLTCQVDITFQYTLIAQQVEPLNGSYQLTATIVEPLSGWRRTVPLQESAAFAGSAFGTTAKLDLCKIVALTQSMEQSTEFHPGSYDLIISPNIQVTGVVAGRTLDTAFNAGPTFKYDRIHFYLTTDSENETPLNLTQTGILSETVSQVNTVRLPGMDATVPTVRVLAVLGLVLAAAGLIFLGLRFQQASGSDPARFIRMRYGAQLIDIRPAEATRAADMVEVLTMDSLAKMAERFNTLILHVEQDGRHEYFVRGEATTYRFVLAPETRAAVPAEKEA